MTDLLYPRLPPAIARELFLEYRLLPVAALRERSGLRHQDAVFGAIGGTEVAEEQLEELAQAIRGAAEASGYPEARGSESDRARFDLAAAEVLHAQMGVVAAEAAAVDVWAFFGAILLPDVCFWRFPDPPEDRVIGPDLTRHTLARLWWRAYQLDDIRPGAGLLALTAIAESEMNQLFERRSIGGNRRLVRAVATALTRSDADWSDTPRRALVRDSAARIQRRLAFSMLEALDDDHLQSEVDKIFASAALALTNGDRRVEPDSPPETDVAHAERDKTSNGEVDEVPSAGPDEPADAPQSVTDFEDVELASVPAQLAQLVSERGGMRDDDLVSAYESRFGVSVGEAERDLVRRFAWSAKGRRFLELDEENGLWLPGQQPPEPIEQLDGWTITRIRDRARQLVRSHPEVDAFETLLPDVYAGDGRVPRLVMSLVGRIVNQVRREQ
jgi:hypothetical protein